MKKLMWIFLLLVQIILCCFKSGYSKAKENTMTTGDFTQWIRFGFDWRPQDYEYSRGITAVQYDETESLLLLSCDLVGNDVSRSQGEIVLDLRYAAGLQALVPLDMTGQMIEVVLDIPPELSGTSSEPNGCQVFVKDQNYNSQYGSWTPITTSGMLKVVLLPGHGDIVQGVTTPGFEPHRIQEIGFKIALHSNSFQQYRGFITIKQITVTPGFSLVGPPNLPMDLPSPFMEAGADVEKHNDGFYIDGKRWFFIGGNWRMLQYRQNFGATPWFPNGNGVSKHQEFLATQMDLFRRAGVTLLRIGLLDDGTTMFDPYGRVIGFNSIFKEDVTAFLSLANRFQIKVEFLLLDSLVAAKGQQINNVYIQGRRQVIENPQVRQHYIQEFLIPFLNQFGNDPVVFGFDIINEPEWFIHKSAGGGWVKKSREQNTYAAPIALKTFIDFVQECKATIRAYAPGKFITVGVSCPNRKILNNLNLDYHAMHYYPPMGDLDWNLTQHYQHKPWTLQEFPANGDIFAYLMKVYEAQGAGAEVWNLSPAIDQYSYSFAEEAGKLQEIRRFADYLDHLPLTLTVSQRVLYFVVSTDNEKPSTQVLFINQSGNGIMEWQVSSHPSWLSCHPGAGTGTAVVTVSVNTDGLVPGLYHGVITIVAKEAVQSTVNVNVTLFIKESGAFENRSIVGFR